MRGADIRAVDPNELADPGEIRLDPNLSPEQRMEQFLEKIQNPYCFRCGSIALKVEYADAPDAPTFLEAFANLMTHLNEN